VTYRVLFIAAALAAGCTIGVTAGEWFTGSWQAEIGLSPQQTMPFSSFASTLDVGFCISFLRLASVSDFTFDGWLWQEFDLTAALGVIRFDGWMLFEPQTGSFLYAQGVLSLELAPFVLSVYAAAVGPTQSESMNYGYVFDIYGEIIGGLFTFESATFIGADLSGISFTKSVGQTDPSLLTKTYKTDPTIDVPPLCFSGQELMFRAIALGCLDLTSVTTFGKLGFVSQEFELIYMGLLGLPLNLTLNYAFSIQTASHSFTPSVETDYGCLKIYTDLLLDGASTITGIEIYGIALDVELGGARFRSISNLDTTKYVITTPRFGLVVEPLTLALEEGHLYYPQEYWEVVSLEVDVPPAGCGFSFSVDTFFSTSTGLLFDWARSTMGVTLALGTSVTTSSSITIDTTGFTQWALAVKVFW